MCRTGNPFDSLCPTGDNADRITRANACRIGGIDGKDKTNVDECPADVVACNETPFKVGCNAEIYEDALEAFCTVGADIFNPQCVNDTHGEVTAATA